MCTNIAERLEMAGCAKGGGDWFAFDHSYVSYDHPFNLQQEHALNVDFVNEAAGRGSRVSVELTATAARDLAEAILAVLDRAQRDGVL
jgi:hypothetical protein